MQMASGAFGQQLKEKCIEKEFANCCASVFAVHPRYQAVHSDLVVATDSPVPYTNNIKPPYWLFRERWGPRWRPYQDQRHPQKAL